MDKQKRLDDISKKISEYEDKLIDLKKSIKKEMDDYEKKEAEEAVNKIRKLKEKIQHHYSELEKADINDEVKLKEIDKNIYSTIESFDNAFKKAGGIFKKHP